jgi:hypothetical protein
LETIMAAKARVEWIRLGYGPGADFDGIAHNVIKSFHGAVIVDVSASATPAAGRPAAPEFGPAQAGYALVRCLGNPLVVAWGGDPKADELNGKYLEPGEEIPIAVGAGERPSFIEIA